ncbi:hypothetical protein [Pontibacter amylolyticus]|uniref:hypothetical protein n=1 Tax=Pontibacter amylolyticus TaxID=1424080 RepID=UPI00166DE232|nr:hypothetical protein [Pontibacter amylolyticus]
MKSKVFINLIISLTYFWFFILIFWNKSGGDIATIFCFATFSLIHLIIVLVSMIRNRRNKNYFALLGLVGGLALNVITFHLLSEYKLNKHLKEGGDRVIIEEY